MGTQYAPAPSPSVSALVALTVMRAGQSVDERDTLFFSYPSQSLVGVLNLTSSDVRNNHLKEVTESSLSLGSLT